ncbi:hypothetical protein COHA_010098 [Chlorella ohadii]|uniref:Galactose oxidase-like Early set domain-containing protein n=1 Tax=Chlorella ohadii TaxID=2649997 RepID=A0AAD5GXH9_9CHLO|nr:hypothetical protein COHA_010098 [Chlorella ohadii]
MWQSGYPTAGLFMIHSNVMKDGKVVGWSTVSRETGFGTALCDPLNPKTWPAPGKRGQRPGCKQILGKEGISGGYNHFCSGQVTTPKSEIIMFGGHNKDIEWLRHFDYANGNEQQMKVYSKPLTSGRWYPGVATLTDGKILMVAGVAKSGCSNYYVDLKTCATANNPTVQLYDPETKQLGGERLDMRDQLFEAFPMSTYPHVIVTPDGALCYTYSLESSPGLAFFISGVAIAAKKSLVKYARQGDGSLMGTSFKKVSAWPERPGPGWVYPQTGQGILLPMEPPYNKMEFIAAGGSRKENATQFTPASDLAWKIELTDPAAQWENVGRMPQERVMGDSVILCDGTIGFFNGAGTGIAGWGTPLTYTYADGVTYNCQTHCSMADRDGRFEHRAPIIYDPKTGAFTERDSLAKAVRPRLYHSSAVLLPSCQVMVSGSDVTGDTTAEVYSPPYLFRGPRPVIVSGSDAIVQGQPLSVKYTSQEPVTKALLLRTSATTHSMPFDARALWLPIKPTSTPGQAVLEMPANPNLTPPGMYMVVLHTAKGAVSNGHIVSVYQRK